MTRQFTQLTIGSSQQSPKVSRLTKTQAATLHEAVQGEVRLLAHDRMLYATDASIYQVEPLGVIIPRDEADVQNALRACDALGLPTLPRGGGTSLAGQCVSEAMVLDTSSNLTDVIELDEASQTVRAGAGMTISSLNRAIEHSGLFFAPDPSTVRQANIGGCIGNNAAGTRSVKYGRTAENVLGVRGYTADGTPFHFAKGSCAATGTIEHTLGRGVVDICERYATGIRERFPKTLRRNAGYALDMMLAAIDQAKARGVDPLEELNLAHLICGSEGTLGVVTQAELLLHPVQRSKGLAVIGFDDLYRAMDAVPDLLKLKPSALELLDDLIIDTARRNTQCAPMVDLMPQPASGKPLKAILYVEFFVEAAGEHGQAEVEERFEALRQLLPSLDPQAGFAAYTDGKAIADALALRQSGEPLLHSIPGSRKPLGFIEDNAVPPEQLGVFVRRLREIVDRHDTTAAYYAHASVGVLHVRPLLDLRSDKDQQAVHAIARDAADLAQELGGVMSGEHGDGRARGPLLERFYGPQLMDAFREVKALFDPKGLLNPGNIVSPGALESITDHTRIQPAGNDRPIHAPHAETYFTYEKEGGFDHAVELCNGAGVCRKTQEGTMCPSYHGTRDERHSTRGRGNALRLAITGQLPSEEGKGSAEPAWDDAETLDTLRLCLSCKACKTECPSNVDVATYKAEYLAQGYKKKGRASLQATVFGNVRVLNKLGSMFAPISSAVAEFGPMRALSDKLLGLAPQRTLPPFDRPLPQKLKHTDGGHNQGLDADSPTVLLYGDCFTMYNEPGIGVATSKVLNAFGYRVIVADAGCCGRTAISTGILETARDTINGTINKLGGMVRGHQAQAIVVCEPSCLSAMKDEWLSFKGVDTKAAAQLSAIAALPEAFLASQWGAHPKNPEFAPLEGELALHGHCHQKALWGTKTSTDLLEKVFVAEQVRTLDTGCCGMAGSFGFTKDRYDLSMKIGEDRLFPQVRELNECDTVCAPGTSCRHQIADGTGTHALHPMEVLANALR